MRSQTRMVLWIQTSKKREQRTSPEKLYCGDGKPTEAERKRSFTSANTKRCTSRAEAFPLRCIPRGEWKPIPLTCLIADKDALLTSHTKCVRFAVTLTLCPHDSGEATVLARLAMARVEFIQVLPKSPLQVQSLHRGTGHLLDQLVQWRQLQRQDLSQCSDFGETGFFMIYTQSHWDKRKSHSCFRYSCSGSSYVSRFPI